MKTFEELRMEYMRDNPPPLFLTDLYQPAMFTKEEFLKRLAEEGIEISPRTLNYYLNIGVMPKPIIGSKRSGKGKESYFSSMHIGAIESIKDLQAEGATLLDIKKVFELSKISRNTPDDTIDACECFDYFFELCNLLVSNLPQDSTEDSMSTYISNEHGNIGTHSARIISDLRKMANLKKSPGFNLKIENTIKAIHAPLWERAAAALFYKTISLYKEDSSKKQVATLQNNIVRFFIVDIYIGSFAKAFTVFEKIQHILSDEDSHEPNK